MKGFLVELKAVVSRRDILVSGGWRRAVYCPPCVVFSVRVALYSACAGSDDCGRAFRLIADSSSRRRVRDSRRAIHVKSGAFGGAFAEAVAGEV